MSIFARNYELIISNGMKNLLHLMLLSMLFPLLSHADGWDEATYKQIEQSIRQPQISGKDYLITKFGAKPGATRTTSSLSSVPSLVLRPPRIRKPYRKLSIVVRRRVADGLLSLPVRRS